MISCASGITDMNKKYSVRLLYYGVFLYVRKLALLKMKRNTTWLSLWESRHHRGLRGFVFEGRDFCPLSRLRRQLSQRESQEKKIL